MFAGFALSLIESSRNLTDRIHLLFVLHAQGEEIDTLAGAFRRSRGGKHDSVAIMHERCSVSLCGDAVDINRERPAGKLHGK